MASVSSESLVAARSVLDRLAPELTLGSARELFAVLNLVDGNAALQRALTDPARIAEERAALASTLLCAKVSGTVLEIVKSVVSLRWSSMRDFVDTFETLGVDAVARVAERDGETGIARLENDLFGFCNTVAGDHDLHAALGLVTAPDESRRALAQGLSKNASQPAQVLLEQAVVHPRGLKVVTLVERFSQFVAARHDLWIAHVESSQELTPEQSQRLAAALKRVYGRELKINATTLPSLIGGVRVRVGDEVVDSSTLGRINHLKQRLAS